MMLSADAVASMSISEQEKHRRVQFAMAVILVKHKALKGNIITGMRCLRWLRPLSLHYQEAMCGVRAALFGETDCQRLHVAAEDLLLAREALNHPNALQRYEELRDAEQ